MKALTYNKICRLHIFTIVFGLILPLITTTIISPAVAEVTNGNNLGVFPPDSKPYGSTYGEWTARWWQWVISIPAQDNPLKDNTGAKCSINQHGPVWFLAGTTGGSADRQCTILAGKAILFPILNAECSYSGNPLSKTESELHKQCKSSIDKVTSLDASIDGKNLQGLDKYRIQSPLFNITFPKDNTFGEPAGPTQAVSDGMWILMQPLSAGKHTIHFRGTIVDFTTTSVVNFATEVTYHLAVR